MSPRVGQGKGGVALQSGDILDLRRSSITETTDEEILYEEKSRWNRKHSLATKNGYPSHHGSKNLVDSNGTYPRGGRNIRKVTGGKRSPEIVQSVSQQESFEEKMLQTLLKSRDFVEKFKRLAVQSGSSAEDSEPESTSIPPHVQKELLDHVHSLMSPVQMMTLNVTIHRNGGFGFSVSDGLLEPGVYVNQIQPNGPADGTGLQPFDKIIKVS